MKQTSTKVLYWSRRRVEAVAEGHGVDLGPHPSTELATPSSALLPVARRQRPARSLTPIEQAERVEADLADLVTRDLISSPGPCAFAAGETTMTFAHLQNTDRDDRAVMLAELSCGQSGRAAICLFGSMGNFKDMLQNADANRFGWSSSSAPAVTEFLRSRGTVVPPGYDDRVAIATEALKIAKGQGLSGHGGDPSSWRPWRRGFTFGDVQDSARWLAEIYCDVDLVNETGESFDGYDRVLIGAPLWMTTSYIKSVRLYEEYSVADLDAAEMPADEATPLRRLGSLIRSWIHRRRSGA